jgi:surface protein
MFNECNSLTTLKIFSFEIKYEVNRSMRFQIAGQVLKQAFFGIQSKLGNFIDDNFRNKVSCIKGMFQGCENLTNLDLSTFDTKKVIDMSFMFKGCKKLNTLNLFAFDTKNVINMKAIFEECENLIELNLKNFDTKNVANMSYMFNRCF